MQSLHRNRIGSLIRVATRAVVVALTPSLGTPVTANAQPDADCPNPVSLRTRIAFRVDSTGAARFELFDVMGGKVDTRKLVVTD